MATTRKITYNMFINYLPDTPVQYLTHCGLLFKNIRACEHMAGCFNGTRASEGPEAEISLASRCIQPCIIPQPSEVSAIQCWKLILGKVIFICGGL
jgi:hypothetical protein